MITDSGGLYVFSNEFWVTVNATLSGVSVTPTTVILAPSGTQQFTAAPRDQFGNAMTGTVTWNAATGSITAAGLYTAPAALNVPTRSPPPSAPSSATATVVVDSHAPTVATPAAANPNPVTGTTTALSVLGADVEGESNLTYTWATTVGASRRRSTGLLGQRHERFPKYHRAPSTRPAVMTSK